MNTPFGHWQYRRSLASRVILLTTIAVGVSVALVALASYLTVRHQILSALDESLHRRAYAAAAYSPSEVRMGDLPTFLQGATDSSVGYVFANGRVVMTRGPGGATVRPGGPEFAVANGASKFSCRTITATDGVDYRVATVPTDEDGIAFIVAQSMQANEVALDKLGLVMFLFGAAGVIAAALAGWGVARNGLRPVRRLTDKAEEIARTEKLDPIAVEGEDEIARLAVSFNATLAALSASRDRQRQLVADAGHELRTPLTSLRTNLELLSQADTRGGLDPAFLSAFVPRKP